MDVAALRQGHLLPVDICMLYTYRGGRVRWPVVKDGIWTYKTDSVPDWFKPDSHWLVAFNLKMFCELDE